MNPERRSQVYDSVEDSFKQCFHSYYEGLHRYAFTILQNNEEAKDVVQAVFIKLWEKRDTINLQQAGRSYLYTAVHNQCLNVIRNNKVKNKYVDHVVKTNTVGREEVPAEAKEVNEKIMQAIESLPDRCREAFQKSRFEGKKYAEIAAEMGISEKTVEMQIGKALKILREHLAEFITGMIIMIIYWLKG